MKINKLKINGFEQTSQLSADPSEGYLQISRSFVIGETSRGETKSFEITLADDEIVEMIFEDGTTWISNSATLEDIFPQAGDQNRDVNHFFEIPDSIEDDNSERGIFRKIFLKIINIFVKKAIETGVEKLAARLEDKQTDGKTGLFRLSADLSLHEFVPDDISKPYCLFIHGTASSIEGSFGKSAGTDVMKTITETYGDRLLAFQHRTLTENPLQNVRDLVKQLPRKASLHLITTSRGGLVGEVLSRFCNTSGTQRGFTQTELALLKKEYPASYFNAMLLLIDEINAELAIKNIVIEKFIRIACPAAGTTLASKRLDTYFNFLSNLIGYGTGIAGNPVYQAFKNLIAAVIDCKNKPEVLPGIEVQNPDSPFIRVLNGIPDPYNPSSSITINNALVVIAGNTMAGFRLKALLIISSKLFFRAKNDLVVDTASMSQGTKRIGRVQQYFYENTDIDHFSYFKNPQTNEAIKTALTSVWGEKIPGFSEEQLSHSISAERNILLRLDGGQVFEEKVSGTKPIVVLLPGIMGSNLALDDTLLWINYWKFITGGLGSLKHKDVKATSLVSTSYRDLVENLQEDYDVVTFPFDWRNSLIESAKLLNDKISELIKFRQPIKLIGHSMGGVLIRDFIASHPETWKTLNHSVGFRIIFLGSPLNGSFRIPSVLFGADGIISKLSKIDQVHSKKELVGIFSGFRGILGLLPFAEDEANDFAKPETWKRMQKGIDESDWPLPTAKDLEWFSEYRNTMKIAMNEADFSNAVYIAGRDKSTVCGYRIESSGNTNELVFLSTAEGDQSVTWESGIPAKMISANTVYYVNVTHGSLANDQELFGGIRELLKYGKTNLFSHTRPAVRGTEKLFRSPVFRDFDLSLAGIENTLLGLGTKTTIQVAEPPLKVSISHGDLFYSRYPVMAGHFEEDGILYAEKTINGYLDNQLLNHHGLGIYPGKIGTSDIFYSENSAFKGAIIIGLGTPGNLTASELTKSVEQGVANFMLHQRNNGYSGAKTESSIVGISSLIVGCGYAGLSIENSVKAILQGVQNANNKVKNLGIADIRPVEHIEFVELYEDKAVSCLYSISRIEKEESRSFRIVRDGKGIKSLLGSRKRIPSDSADGWWNRITVSREEDKDDAALIRRLKFRASTSSSREEEKTLMSTPVLMEGIIEEMSTNNQWTPEKARTIFELLIPNDFKEQLKRNGNISWILDNYTASYPWELLQDGIKDTKPICISAGMIRQLSTDNFRQNIKIVPKNTALIIADPDLKGFANQLPGALKEGQLVAGLLAEQGLTTTSSFKGNHSEIIEKLFRDDYKIIHLSGHGIFNQDILKGSGMVIGKNLFLSTREIQQMSSVPEIVFVNCCHLGKSDGVAEEFYQDRYKLAANIGTQLIQNGVRCVIAAGWAVNDDAALEFAAVFYKRMFEGYNFGDSVKDARIAVYEKFGHTNTWGAYQCYGDPFYKFENTQTSRKKTEKTFMISQEAEVELMNLLQELEIGKLPSQDYLLKLKTISEAVDKAEIRNSVITEKEALIFLELGEYDQSCEKFSSLLTTEEASFSFAVAEKYCNARSKKILLDFRKSPKNSKDCNERIKKVIKDLVLLLELSPTSERFNIIGSTYKRQAFMLKGNIKTNSYILAAEAYQHAYSNLKNWYSLTNWLALESSFVRAGLRTWNSQTDSEGTKLLYLLPSREEAILLLDQTRTGMIQNADRMSYWDMLACLNIRLCKYILMFSDEAKQAEIDEILKEIVTLWKIAGSKGKRFAEIEHLEFIIDSLSISENTEAISLKSKLEEMKNELLKLI